MNKELYLTQAEYSGPWLLDAKTLKDLDSRISNLWAILEDRRKAKIEDEMPVNLKRYVASDEQIPEDVHEQIVHYRSTHRYSQKSKKEFNITLVSAKSGC